MANIGKTDYEYTPARRRVWQHNSMVGSLCMARRKVQDCIEHPTSSTEAKRQAQVILLMLDDLIREAKNRIDPPSSP